MARRLEREYGTSAAWLFASGRRAPSRPRQERTHLGSDAGLIAKLRRLSGTDGRVLGDEDVLRMVLPATRSDYRAADTYEHVPGTPLTCPITVFVGDDDPKVTIDEARAWRDHTTGSFDLQIFDGGHFYLTSHQSGVLKIVADLLRLAG